MAVASVGGVSAATGGGDGAASQARGAPPAYERVQETTPRDAPAPGGEGRDRDCPEKDGRSGGDAGASPGTGLGAAPPTAPAPEV
jgi:hypothetical protein